MFGGLKFSDFALSALPVLGMAWGWPWPSINCGCCAGATTCRCTNIIWSDNFGLTSGTGTGPESFDPSYTQHNCAASNPFKKFSSVGFNRLKYFNNFNGIGGNGYASLYQTITTPTNPGLCVSVEANVYRDISGGFNNGGPEVFIGGVAEFMMKNDLTAFQYTLTPTSTVSCVGGSTNPIASFTPVDGDLLTLKITETAATGSASFFTYTITMCINNVVAKTVTADLALGPTLNVGIAMNGLSGTPMWDNLVIATG